MARNREHTPFPMTSQKPPIGLCLSLILPSTWVFQKYLGLWGAGHAGTALQTIEARRIELGFLGFGLCFVFFGALAFWMMLQEKGKARAWG